MNTTAGITTASDLIIKMADALACAAKVIEERNTTVSQLIDRVQFGMDERVFTELSFDPVAERDATIDKATVETLNSELAYERERVKVLTHSLTVLVHCSEKYRAATSGSDQREADRRYKDWSGWIDYHMANTIKDTKYAGEVTMPPKELWSELVLLRDAVSDFISQADRLTHAWMPGNHVVSKQSSYTTAAYQELVRAANRASEIRAHEHDS